MNCPHCQNPVESLEFWEFFDCKNCGASLQLENEELKLLKSPEDLDENLGGEPFNPPAQEDISSPSISPLEDETDGGSQIFTASLDQDGKDFTNLEGASSLNEISNAEDLIEEEESANEDLKNRSNILEMSSVPAEENENLEKGLIDSTSDLKKSQTQQKEKLEDLSVIADFGNVPLQKNHFTYQLEISGIDHAETLSQVQKILKTDRLKLDFPQLLSQIQDGNLLIENLHAVQTVYLVRKLSSLPVAIIWRQKSNLLE